MEEQTSSQKRPIRVYITPIKDGVKADLNGKLVYKKTEAEIWDLIAGEFGETPCLVHRRPPILAETMPLEVDTLANGADRFDTVPSTLDKINPHMEKTETEPQPQSGKTEIQFQTGIGGCSFKFDRQLDQIAFLDKEIPMIINLFVNHLSQRLQASKEGEKPEQEEAA